MHERSFVILTEEVKRVAFSSGLDMVGISPAGPFTGYRWRTSKMRDPRISMPVAKSLVIVGVCDLKRLIKAEEFVLKGKIARSYAAGHEYNLVDELMPVKNALEDRGYQAQISPGGLAESTLPLKLAATRAGLGWQGKNSLVITPNYGSWVTFGGLITNAPLDYETPAYRTTTRCGQCTACLDACPTGAIQEPYVVRMSACLDEILNTPGHIPDDVKEKIGNRILSCDICQEVCPYNTKTLKKYKLPGNTPYEYDLLNLLDMDESQFERAFGKLNWSIDLSTFKRNTLIALGNTGGRPALRSVKKFVTHGEEIIRDVSQWALNKINHSGNI